MALDASPFSTFPTGTASPNRFSGAFPDPYLDYASTQMPRSIYDVLRWAEFLFLTYGTYRMASQRVVRYFLTSIELLDISDDEKQKYEDFMNKDLRIMDVLADAGDNFQAYGNDFLSIYVPFRRYLRCPKCHLERPIQKTDYRWTEWKFQLKCQQCGRDGPQQRVDRKSLKQDKLRVVHWSPHEIRILFHPISGKALYYWEIPAIFKREIERGNTFYLESTPWELIEACKLNRLFRFNDDVIYHLKENTIAGLRSFGWGIPRILSNFKQAWYIQVLKRYNEAIALDYIIPFRILTPAPNTTSREADPLLHMNLQSFQSRVLAMFKQHRRDPTTIHALPFAAKLEMLGAGGAALSPTDLLDKGVDELLNAQGIPAELYRGTLQIQALPAALRLFERTWVHMISGFNGLLNWLLTRCSEIQNWEKVEARLQPVTLADDLEKKQIQLQLAAGQQISRQTAWAPFGINYRDEIKKLFAEEEYSREQMARFQEEQSHKQELQQTMAQGAMGALPQQAGMQPGGSPEQAAQAAAAGQGTPPTPQSMAAGAAAGMQPGMAASAGQVTPEDLSMQAEQIAMQMLGMPYELRRSELLKIKKSNETLHSLVIAKMDKVRQNAQTQGGFQALQQMVGSGANM